MKGLESSGVRLDYRGKLRRSCPDSTCWGLSLCNMVMNQSSVAGFIEYHSEVRSICGTLPITFRYRLNAGASWCFGRSGEDSHVKTYEFLEIRLCVTWAFNVFNILSL